jgi:transposase
MVNIGFMGADVSKGHCDFILLNKDGMELGALLQLDDTCCGHQELLKLLNKARLDHDFAKIVVGLESTGGYENNWYSTLQKCSAKDKIEVLRINPTRIYYEARAEGRKTIDDGVSARVIASHIRKNYDFFNSQKRAQDGHGDELKQLRSLNKYIASLTKQEVRLKNRLEKILYSSMPELLALKGEKYPKWFLKMLRKFPGSEQIIKAGVSGLSEINYVSENRANQILESVHHSVGTQDSVIDLIIREITDEILHLETKITNLTSKLKSFAREIFESQLDLVTSVRGIADHTAVSILLELGSVQRFATAPKVVSFFGINPVFKSSGDYTGKAKMSKTGSSTARAVLYMAANNVILHEPFFKAIYARHRARNKSHNEAVVVVMSKLVRIIYGMLKSNQPFDAGVDLLNQEKKTSPNQAAESITAENETEVEKQKQAMKAPVSYRERKRRTKQFQKGKNGYPTKSKTRNKAAFSTNPQQNQVDPEPS